MKTFLICPVRGHSPEETAEIVTNLEKEGWEVHWPHRDTNQEDEHGLNICKENREAIIEADIIHLIWDGKSTGSLFDLGMTFALRKEIKVIDLPPLTEGKSFQNMITKWANEKI